MSSVSLGSIFKELLGFVKSLPEIYRTINFADPLILAVLILLGSFAVGLVMSVRSPVVTLLIIFTMLVLSFVSQPLHTWLASHTTVLLSRHLITKRYFDDNGRFFMAIWTFPMFCIATFFTLIMIVTLLVEISNQIKNVSKEAKEAKEAKEQSSKAETEDTEPQPAEAAAEPASEKPAGEATN